MTARTALRVLSWTAVFGVLLIAVCARSAERPSWCPTDVPPSSCAQIAPTFPTAEVPAP